MALIKWGDDEEQKKRDELLGITPVKTVASVQSGSWQPAPSGADAPATQDDTKPKVNGGVFDQQQAQPGLDNYLLSDEHAQAEEQKRKRDAEIEAARQQQIAAQQAANARAVAAQEAEIIPETPKSRPKYGGGKKKNEGGVSGFLKDVGAGIQQGLGSLADIAIQGGGVIGSVGKNDRQLVQHVAEVEKVRNWLHGGKDINSNNFVGTRDVEPQARDIVAGRGDIEDYAAIAGKGLQAGIDATMFINPARMALPAKVMPVVDTATLATKVLQNPALRYAGRDAAFYGGLQGTATFQTVYGQTGDFEQAIEAALQDATIGATLQGTLDMAGHMVGKGVRKGYESLVPVANKTINSLREPGEFTPVIDVPQNEGGALNTPQERPNNVPEPVADGVAQPQDGNVTFESNLDQPTNLLDNAANDLTPETTPVADGISQLPEQVTPASVVPEQAPVDAVTPVNDATVPQAPDVAPVADGVALPSEAIPAVDPNMPVIAGENVRQLQDARAGASQADEAVINQKLQEAEAQTPAIDGNVPEGLGGDGVVNTETGTPLTSEQVAERLMPKLASNDDVKQRIATAVDMGKDTASPVRDILRDGKVNPKQAERVATHFDTLEKQLQEYNRLEEQNQKAYAEKGTEGLDENVSRERSRAAREMGITTRRLMTEIKRIEGSRDKKVALINNVTNLIGTRNANILTSAGLLERNVAQEISANLKLAVKNPIKMAKSTFNNGNIIKDTVKSELSHWKDKPANLANPIEIAKYVIGNTYRTGMIPTTALANTRRGAVRDELTKWAYQELEGRKVPSSEAHKLAGTAGNEMEALVNTFIGVDNGMTNRGQATAALKAWKEYIRTGDDGAKSAFLAKVENHNSLADQMISGLSKEDETKARGLMAMKNLIFPFVRTATNLAKNTVKQDLNPFAKSLIDEIGADQRSGGANAINLIKSKLVDYGIMGGAAALASSGVLVYNDGDQIDKPKGWSVKTGENQYVPVRSTSLELPMALAGTAQAMWSDTVSGKPRDWKYYAGMVTNSLPYIDQFTTTNTAVDSLLNGEDAGYAAKAYGVNTAKSFVPWSNNGIQPYVAGKKGESINAKSVYDENLVNWFTNTVRKSYDPEFYDTLKDSRDNAGRVRTVDNQGFFSNKTINDKSTAEFNTRITDLVDYGRENGLGENTKDMFNTYDTGKNNNFKSVQDSITFLDAVNGKPDNAKKLEKNAKLTDLSRQMRDGFYGETGSELLTLDGKGLKSDASVPNKAGSKNSKLPVSMQSIKNAIAQTDLPPEQSDKLYAISGQSTELYNQLKAKSISYDQYSAAKAKLGQQEIDILSGSESYKKMVSLFDELDQTGFFEADGLGSTRSGQTYLWNSLNALLGSKGATPAANYPDSSKGFTPYGRGGGKGSGKGATNKPGDRKNTGIQWTPVKSRQAEAVADGKYTPVGIKVKLGNAVKKDKSRNYADRSF